MNMMEKTTEPVCNNSLLTARDVAKRLKISRALAYQLMASGELPTVRIRGKIVRVTEVDLQEYINSCRAIRCVSLFDAKMGRGECTLPTE
jgi:excisionase family DNA binding protein